MERSGSVIVIVLVISAAAFATAFFVISVAKRMTFVSQSILDKLEAKLEAESAVERLAFAISSGEFHENYVSVSLEGVPEKIHLDGRWQKLGNRTQFSAIDGSSKFSLFSVPFNLIGNVLSSIGNFTSSSVFLSSLEDWCDSDSFERFNGAEESYYGSLGFKYHPRNYMAIQSADELELIRGLLEAPEPVKAKVKSLFSPCGSSFINVNTVSREVLAALLGIDHDLADVIIAMREEKGYLDYSDFRNFLGNKFNNPLISTFPNKCIILIVKADVGFSVERLKTVLDFKGSDEKPYSILEWKE